MSTLWEKTESGTESAQSMSSESDTDELSSDLEDDSDSGDEGGSDEAVSDQEETGWKHQVEQVAEHSAPMLNKQELLRQHHLKEHIDKLEVELQRKQDILRGLRKQSFRCKEQQSLLLGEKTYLEEAMAGSAETCLGMFHGRISKLMMDMDGEKEMEQELRVSISKAENDLLVAQVAVNEFDQFRGSLEEGETLWKETKDREFTRRLQGECNLATSAKKRKEAVKRQANRLKIQQAAANNVIEDWKKTNKSERAFLQTALNQHKASKAKEAEDRHKEHLEKRMNAILHLKENISASKGTIQARLLLKQEKELKQKNLEELERKTILEEKGIPEEHFLRKKRFQQFQSMLENFKKKQEERKLNIVEKLLKEEQFNKQTKLTSSREQSYRSKPKKKKHSRVSLTAPSHDSIGLMDKQRREALEQVSTSESDSDLQDEGIPCHALSAKQMNNVMEPEIRGLWDRSLAPTAFTTAGLSPVKSASVLEKEGSTVSNRKLSKPVKKKTSKMEVQMMEKAMEKLRKSKVLKQIAAGREFKGQAFCSKPKVVVFRNFDVGKMYTKKVRLTNVSYTVNRCQLEGVSHNLADFITVMFDPPGSMSAGMSCSMQVSFLPQVNEDIDGEIRFLSQTGPFSLSVKCLTKKCLVILDRTQLDFGIVYVGETFRQRVTLHNAGALATRYSIAPLSNIQPPPQPPNEATTVASSDKLTQPDFTKLDSAKGKISDYSIMSDVETSRLRLVSSGVGVITSDSCAHRLRSKSTDQISFSPTNEEQTLSPDKDATEGKDQDSSTAQQDQDKDNPKKSQSNSQDKSKTQAKGKSQAKGDGQGKSRGKKSQPPNKLPHKSQGDTPGISLQDLSSPHPESQDTPQPESRDTPSQDTPQPRSQDTPQLESQEVSQLGSQDAVQAEIQDTVGAIGTAAESTIIKHTADPAKVGRKMARAGLKAPPSDSSMSTSLESGVSAFQVGGIPSGIVAPFSSQAIELVYTPHTVAQHLVKFCITFSEPATPLVVTACGCGIDVPVYVEQEELYLRICMLDRLYQISVVLHNRASTAHQVTFQVPSDLQPFLELLPKHGVVQGEASLSVQLKFQPLEAMLDREMYERYYTESDDMWRMPVHVGVANQSHPVTFQVLAHVTPSQLVLSPPSLEFGSCTTVESVFSSLTITNTSILPQTYGFIDIPACVSIQPNDGFGELLPNDSMEVDVIFSAKEPKEYAFDLICKSGLDKKYRVACTGKGVLSPLRLSHNSISFQPTAIGNSSYVRLSIINPKLSPLDSAVIRGVAPDQGPKAFQFNPPANCPITFSPQVGVVPLGQSVGVQVQFSPKLLEDKIVEEALRLTLLKALGEDNKARRMDIDSPQAVETTKKRKRRKSLSGASPLVSSYASLTASFSQNNPSSGSGEISKEVLQSLPQPEQGSEVWLEGYRSLLSSYTNQCMEFKIPCFVSDTVEDDQRAPVYQQAHTLYLEVTAPAVRASLMLAEGNTSKIDFGSIGTGDVTSKRVRVINITSLPLALHSSLLDPRGPFQLRNALRVIPPQESHELLLNFSPMAGGKIYDSLVLYSGTSSVMELHLTGMGVHPRIDVSLGSGENISLDMGHAMARDVVSKAFTLINSSPLKVRYKLNMESQLPKKCPAKSFRACNYSGQPPFVCVPSEGVVDGKGSKEIRLFFTPDHQSSAYSDKLIATYNEQLGCNISLSGHAWNSNMYVVVIGDCDLEDFSQETDDKESMIPAVVGVAEDATPPPQSLLLMFSHTGVEAATKRQLEIGCIKSGQVKKTTGDFTFDMPHAANSFTKCFTFDVLKGSIEAGNSRTLSISFSPPKDVPCSLVACNATLTLKGSTTQVYHLLLRALVSE